MSHEKELFQETSKVETVENSGEFSVSRKLRTQDQGTPDIY